MIPQRRADNVVLVRRPTILTRRADNVIFVRRAVPAAAGRKALPALRFFG